MRAAAFLLVSLSACAQPATSQADPCSLVGTYALDRASIHEGIIASTDESLANLGDRPPQEGVEQTVWDMQRRDFGGVRADALAGEIVPETRFELYEGGRFALLSIRSGHTTTEAAGRWSVDAACQALVFEAELDDGGTRPMATRVEGDRIIMADPAAGGDGTPEAHAFVRVR